MKHIGLVLLVAVAGASAACHEALAPPPTPPPDDVMQFLSPLPKLRSATTVFAFPDEGFLLFFASYGDPQDCPAGCFFARAWGIKYAGQIGWVEGAPPTEPRYDVRPSDKFLFDQALWNRIESEWIGAGFRIMLACDPDTPPDALEQLAIRLPADGWPFLADLLVDVAQRRDLRRVAEIISDLRPSTFDYSHSKAHAAAALANWPSQPSGGYCPS